ncbi:hypothetical protein ABBQ38_012599 [Trebouxia sp. C0009 RCD-2024]
MEQLQLLRLHQLLSEAAGTTGRPAQMSGGQQQARQSSGAVQFEFGKPVGEAAVLHFGKSRRQEAWSCC